MQEKLLQPELRNVDFYYTDQDLQGRFEKSAFKWKDLDNSDKLCEFVHWIFHLLGKLSKNCLFDRFPYFPKLANFFTRIYP